MGGSPITGTKGSSSKHQAASKCEDLLLPIDFVGASNALASGSCQAISCVARGNLCI